MVSHTLFLSRKVGLAVMALAFAAAPLFGGSGQAMAQQAIYAPGEPIVTGFSGTAPPNPPPITGDPLDQTFIDTSGASMIIQRLGPDGPPAGQVIDAPTVFSASAADIGQVFGIALDDATVPNIYLTATSAYGLDIVVPGSDGNPARSKVGAPNATFMAGMWGSAGDSTGNPGSIWQIDGTTGAIVPFATIPDNSGAGLGNIVFDPATEQFFVSDLDNGLIYRVGMDGKVIDSFDHGVTGRPTHSLAAVPDDGSEIDVTNPSFNSEDPSTWGFTQPERKVYGLAVHSGRLYYAVAAGPQIWSVGINADGSFGSDPQWELDVTGLPSGNEITNIVFDPEGRMILAQRGPQVGSYDYSVFATPQTSSVVRYSREVPDDPTTPSTWVETPDSYAIGFRPAGENTDGGLALGYGYDPTHQDLGGACSAFLWTTGESLVDAPLAAGATPTTPPATVDGLQGNDRELVRPQNDPPTQSYFTEYNAKPADPANAGHIGDVDIWQNCQGAPAAVAPPVFLPPVGYLPPPPNLTLHKFPIGRECFQTPDGWRCEFDLRISNTGRNLFWGPLTVDDQLPSADPTARMVFDANGPWQCGPTGPGGAECNIGSIALYPGESTDVRVGVMLPPRTRICVLDNAGQIIWRDGRGNTGRDSDFASQRLPNRLCPQPPPPGSHTNLKLTKRAFPKDCTLTTAGWSCTYLIDVQNTGPGVYNAPIQVKDLFGVPAVLSGGPSPWVCGQTAMLLTCNRPPTLLVPGQHVLLGVKAVIPVAEVVRGKLCSVSDSARITLAPGGSALNTNPGDDSDSATSVIPARDCGSEQTDLSLTKTGYRCEPLQRPLTGAGGAAFVCIYEVVIKNLGPGSFNGPLHFSDHFSPAVSGVTSSSNVVCTASGGGYDCASALSVSLSPGQSVSYQVNGTVSGRDICQLTNTATITSPPGGSPQNTNPANDSGTATLKVPNPTCGGLPGRLTIVKTPGTCSAPLVAAVLASPGQAIACTFTVTATNSGAGPVSGPIVVKDTPAGPGSLHITSSQCTANNAAGTCTSPGALAAGGSFGFNVTVLTTQRVANDSDCKLNNTATIISPAGGPSASATDTVPATLCGHLLPPPPPPVKLCPPGSTGIYPACVCPPGTRGTPGNCIPIRPRPPINICPADSTGIYPDCVCAPGSRGTPGNCIPTRPRPPINVCPADSTGIYPDCVCKPRTFGVPGACVINRPPPKLCPADSTGIYPACVCAPGTHGTPGACVPNRPRPPVKLCPADSTGQYPDCTCKPGTRGVPGSCVISRPPPPRFCPTDSTGRFPDCTCKTGTHGRPGQCVPNTLNLPTHVNPGLGNGLVRLCPRGSVGTYPNCHCPPGTVGRPPRCVPEESQPKLQLNPGLRFNPGLLNRAGPERPVLR